jgi:hypothetical protein
VGVHDHTPDVGDGRSQVDPLAEPAIQRDEGVLYEILGQASIAAQQVRESGQCDRMRVGEGRQRYRRHRGGGWLHIRLNATTTRICCA